MTAPKLRFKEFNGDWSKFSILDLSKTSFTFWIILLELKNLSVTTRAFFQPRLATTVGSSLRAPGPK